jgi:hypothetical protein
MWPSQDRRTVGQAFAFQKSDGGLRVVASQGAIVPLQRATPRPASLSAQAEIRSCA